MRHPDDDDRGGCENRLHNMVENHHHHHFQQPTQEESESRMCVNALLFACGSNFFSLQEMRKGKAFRKMNDANLD